MLDFNVTVKTASVTQRFLASAATSMIAFMNAVAAHGDTPCSITVIPVGASQ
jgi:hypothetical protein